MKIVFKNIFILILASFSLSDFAFAQQTPVKKDSTLLYKKIETYSEQGKVKKLIYGMVFKPATPVPTNPAAKNKGYRKLIQKPYSNFEGKIIRSINVVTMDPFGYSVTDTAKQKQNFFYAAGNGLHIKTQDLAILNLMLIHKNQPFSTILVKESERLIRTQKYVHEVYFYIASGEKSDSVDIFIRVLDKWSLVPIGSVSTTSFKIGIAENNFLGFGHEFKTTFSRNTRTAIDAFNADYLIPNIRNTFISSKLHYMADQNGYLNKSLSLDRPFFSPLARWAAGVSFATQYNNDSLKNSIAVYTPIRLKFKTQDYWAGYAYRIFRNGSDKESITNLVMTVRYLNISYSEKPSEYNDPLHIYSSENFYLASIGISARKYVQDKFIYRYGVIEDVPVGKVVELTGGYQVKSKLGRPYLGLRFSFGNYFQWGYLSYNIEYGTFFHSSHTEQGVISMGATYFTGLIEIGKWKFRQFIKPQFIIGLNRFPYDTLTLNEGYGLEGFRSAALSGTRRLIITLQTQTYSPWHVMGFHFGPFMNCSFGVLGDNLTGFKNRTVYSQIGVGVLIKNENLVINSFQLSFSFYPVIPGKGQDVFLMNAFRTSDFGFQDFGIGKPGKARYQ